MLKEKWSGESEHVRSIRQKQIKRCTFQELRAFFCHTCCPNHYTRIHPLIRVGILPEHNYPPPPSVPTLTSDPQNVPPSTYRAIPVPTLSDYTRAWRLVVGSTCEHEMPHRLRPVVMVDELSETAQSPSVRPMHRGLRVLSLNVERRALV